MLLSLIDAERAHNIAIKTLEVFQSSNFFLRLLERRFVLKTPKLSQRICGLDFSNPVGLAAGWDKNARVPQALAALGFGFVELGTVTLEPEKGNPRPRIWRSFKEEWILNRVGFANDGVQVIAERLNRGGERGDIGDRGCVVGISLGKNIASSPSQLADEVISMLESFYSLADFFVVNVSSPNTPQWLELEKPEFLKKTLTLIKDASKKPLFVKIGPMTSDDSLHATADALLEACVDGVIATNTMPTDRGGLSGRPLRALALKTTARLYLALEGAIPIIGVGGILTPEDAWSRILSGARAIELFSGFVFYGPNIIKKILEYLDEQLVLSGFKNLEEACGVRAKEFAA